RVAAARRCGEAHGHRRAGGRPLEDRGRDAPVGDPDLPGRGRGRVSSSTVPPKTAGLRPPGGARRPRTRGRPAQEDEVISRCASRTPRFCPVRSCAGAFVVSEVVVSEVATVRTAGMTPTTTRGGEDGPTRQGRCGRRDR